MSIGARLKEERIRLALSQSDFAALAGASKGAQLKWEKDEASPNAVALVAFAEAGADVLYILSGQRQAEPLNQRAEADVHATLDRLENTLSFPQRDAAKEGLAVAEVLEGVRQALERIATSTSPDVSEPARARADDVIRAHFPDDRGAAKRRSARFASLMLRQQNAGRDLEDVLKGMEVELPRNLHHHLLQLAIDYQINTRDLIPLLTEVSRPYREAAARRTLAPDR